MLRGRIPPLVRVAVLRHVALILATLAAYCLQEELLLSRAVLGVLALAVPLNVATAQLAKHARVARWLSVAVGCAAWSALIALTGGADSPFIAGLSVELLCSAALFSADEMAAVTLQCLCALSLPQAAHGSFPPAKFWVEGAFLIALGALTASIRRHWAQRETRWHREAEALGARLGSLEQQLGEARVLSLVGERAVRQSHLLKSTVYSLRGLVRLVETAHSEVESTERFLIEIGRTIDRLQELVRANLHVGAEHSEIQSRATVTELQLVSRDVANEVGRNHAGVRWRHAPEVDVPLHARFSSQALREVALVLLENAAEAAGEGGSVSIRWQLVSDRVRLDVEDDGPGLGALAPEALFRCGVTTKSRGHGVGLFLSKRLAESFGGELTATPRDRRGMRFSLSLQVLEG